MLFWIKCNQLLVWLIVQLYRTVTCSRVEAQLEASDLHKDLGYVFASNHLHRVDPFIVCTILPLRVVRSFYPMHFMAYWHFFKHWFLRWPLLSLGAFPTKPIRNLDYGLPFSMAVLANHGSIFIFPEGKRVRGEKVQARHGVEVLATLPNVEVVLCNITWRRPWLLGFRVVVAKPKSYAGIPAQEILEDIYRLAP